MARAISARRPSSKSARVAAPPHAPRAVQLRHGAKAASGVRKASLTCKSPIPFRGWLLDADTFKTRVNSFLDHSNIGNSSIYFPVTIDGALVRAWKVRVLSPRLWQFEEAHLAYSNQIAEQRGSPAV